MNGVLRTCFIPHVGFWLEDIMWLIRYPIERGTETPEIHSPQQLLAATEGDASARRADSEETDYAE